LSCNGYSRLTSPNIDKIASEGVSFTNCHAANSPCLPSRAALFSGRFGFNNGIVSHSGEGEHMRPNSISHHQDAKKPFWVHHLWKHGYRTVAFSSFADRHNAWWWSAGWAEHYTPTQKKGSETAEEIGNPALRWLDQNAGSDNWFLDVHFWDAHSVYRVPKEYVTKFHKEPAEWLPDEETLEQHRQMYGPRTARDILVPGRKNYVPPNHTDEVRTPEDVKLLIDGYDGSIAHVDYYVGKILEVLKAKDVLEDTAVIISADHGDCFGEMGLYMDHCIASPSVHNIPMIIRWPGMQGRGHNNALIYNLDLCPTTCRLLNLPVPSEWDGESFDAAVRGETFEGREYLVYDHGIHTLSRGVRTKDWALVALYHSGLYSYDERFYVYDMVNDPHQLHNLYYERRDIFNLLSGYLFEWRMDQVQKGGAPDPLENMVATGPYAYITPAMMEERLRETGREEMIPRFSERLARIRIDQCRKN